MKILLTLLTLLITTPAVAQTPPYLTWDVPTTDTIFGSAAKYGIYKDTVKVGEVWATSSPWWPVIIGPVWGVSAIYGDGRESSIVSVTTVTTTTIPDGTISTTTAITCPVGSVDIFPGANVPSAVWNAGNGASICLHAGLHQPASPIYVRTGQTITCEYGTTIDGTYTTQSYDQGGISIISGWNTGGVSDGFTLRNCIVQRSEHNCIGAATVNNWHIEYNEVRFCGFGVNTSSGRGFYVGHNDIHNNGRQYLLTDPAHAGAFGGFQANDAIYEYNHIHDNTGDNKFCYCAKDTNPNNIIFRHNLVERDEFGIWFDGDNSGTLIEDNEFNDINQIAIMNEVSGFITIRRNIIRRAGEIGIFLSTSNGSNVYENIVNDSWRYIEEYVNCDAILRESTANYSLPRDHANNSVHHNTYVMTTAVKSAPSQAYLGGQNSVGCSDAERLVYFARSKNNVWDYNNYQLYDPNGAWWFWNSNVIGWGGWQALPQDVNGTINGTVTLPPPPPPPPPPADTIAPTVTMRQPTRSGKSNNYSVTATATDNVGVTWFALSIDGQVFANQPGSYTVKIATTGTHIFKADAKDAAGNESFVTQSVIR